MAIRTFRTAGEVTFGAGALSLLPEKVKGLGGTRALLVTDKGMRSTGTPDGAAEALRSAGLHVDIFDAVAGEPSLQTVEACRAVIGANRFDAVVGLGGGSAMDTAKAAACLANNEGAAGSFFGVGLIPNPGLPLILLPTTAGTASEVTPNAIFADLSVNVKKGIVSPYLLPAVALIDPELTYSCPPAVTAASGMDALVHAIESYISLGATPLTQGNALKAIELIGGSLRRAVENGKDAAAREAMAWGSLIAGFSFANAGVGGVHALAYPLGGAYHVSHGVSNALLLAPVMEFSAPAKPALFADIARAMGVKDEGQGAPEMARLAVQAMQQLADDVGIPRRMRDVGVPEEAIDPMAEAAIQIDRLLVNNARPMTVDDIRDIYRKAW
jgi:alcohol dehydrogenase